MRKNIALLKDTMEIKNATVNLVEEEMCKVKSLKDKAELEKELQSTVNMLQVYMRQLNIRDDAGRINKSVAEAIDNIENDGGKALLNIVEYILSEYEDDLRQCGDKNQARGNDKAMEDFIIKLHKQSFSLEAIALFVKSINIEAPSFQNSNVNEYLEVVPFFSNAEGLRRCTEGYEMFIEMNT